MKTWQANILDPNAPHNVNAFSDTSASVFADLEAGERIDLTSLLVHENLNPYHISMVVRATYIFRARVDGWYEARDRAYADFIKYGKDPKGAMMGLMDVTPEDTYEGHPLIRNLLIGEE